jgi:hypothetical protein
MATIHIFGLNHFLQNLPAQCSTISGIEDEKQQKAYLRNALQQMIAAHGVDHIADEAKVVHESLGYEVAQGFGLPYTNITMPLGERERHGIRTPGYNRNPDDLQRAYRVFEKFMFDRIKAANREVTLVLCGRRHLQGLADLFRTAKDDVKTYDIYDYEWYRGIPQEAVDGIVGYEREDDGT